MTVKRRNGILLIIIGAIMALCTVATLGVILPDGNTAIAAEDTHFTLSDADGFITLSEEVASGDNKSGIVYEITNDIDLSAVDYIPVSSNDSNTLFHGTIHGNGHTVKVDLSGYKYCALIGRLGSMGTVSDLTVEGSLSGEDCVAAVVAENLGTVSACVNRATVINTGTNQSVSFAGGIVAINEHILTQCVNLGSVSASYNAGGIVGSNRNNGTLTSCVSLGSLTISGSASNVGGVAGAVSGSMTDCYAYATLSGIPSARTSVGLLVGGSSSATANTNYVIKKGASTLNPSGSSGSQSGKFEEKTLYEFLSETEIEFTYSNYEKADYLQEYGYLYAPSCLLKENAEGKKVFISDDIGDYFKENLFDSGTGEESSPYEIKSLNTWKLFATNSLLYSYEGVHIRLATGGTFAVGDEISLFSEETPFCGVFDGNNKTITVNYSKKINNVGVFAYVGNATLKNLTVGGTVLASRNAAGLVANAVGNLTVQNIVNNCSITADANLGGIIGNIHEGAKVTLADCYNKDGKISGTLNRGVACVGGIVGRNDGELVADRVANYAIVRAENTATTAVGGIVGGSYEKITLSAAHNEGDIGVVVRNDDVGGLVGIVSGEGIIESASSVMKIYGRTYVGGLVGRINGNVQINAFAVTGEIQGRDYVTGICYLFSGTLDLTAGYFTGKITEVSGTTSAEVFHNDPIALKESETIVTAEKVYFNSDFYTKTCCLDDVLAKNTIQLTRGTDALFGTSQMQSSTYNVTGGQYAFPTDIMGFLVHNGLLKVEYFSGVEEDASDTVYLIGSREAFLNFAFLCANSDGTPGNDYTSYKYKMTANIVIGGRITLIPEFSGTFDGNFYTISGINIVSDRDNVGLFGSLTGATVKSLEIFGTFESNGSQTVYMGSICGTADENTTITACHAGSDLYGYVKGDKTSGTTVGGLVGYNKGTISISYFTGSIKRAYNAGGIVGVNEGTVENCFFNSKMTASENAGGIAYAITTGGTVTKCYVNGRVEGKTIGGITASLAGTVEKVYVIADLVGETVYAITANGTVPQGCDCYYNYEYISGTMAYPGMEGAIAEVFAKKEEFFRISGGGNFSVEGFIARTNTYNSTYDAYLAPYLAAFTEMEFPVAVSEDLEKSTAMLIFGTDTSSYETAGAENNPYLVSTAYQFKKISELTRHTDFYGKFFRVECSIDLSEDGSENLAIGCYDNTNGRPFRGTVYGKLHTRTNEEPWVRPTIGNVNISRAYNSVIQNYTNEYLGVFGYTGEGFCVKDLIFEGSVTGTENIGGIVGYMYKGRIENCLSYIGVKSDGEIAGGMIATGSGAINIVGSIVVGEVWANINGETKKNGLGILGNKNQNISVSSVRVWYLVDSGVVKEYLKDGNIKNYGHNGVGHILFHEKTVEYGQDVIVSDEESGFGFTVSNNRENYIIRICTGEDIEVASSADDNFTFFDTDQTSNSVKQYYVRYCYKIMKLDIKLDGVLLNQENEYVSAAYKSGNEYFYDGQEATLIITMKEGGVYAGIMFDKLKVRASSGGEDIIREVSFPDNTEGYTVSIKYVIQGKSFVTVEMRTVPAELVTVTGTEEDGVKKVTYDGTTHDPILNSDALSGYSIDIGYYDATTNAKKTEIKGAGEYRIVVRIRTSNNNYVGMKEIRYVVKKRVLSLGDTSAFEEYFETVYDKTSKERKYVLNGDTNDYNQYIHNNVSGEYPGVTLTFEYKQLNAGENIGLKITNSVSMNPNYTFEVVSLNLGEVGIINKRLISVGYDLFVLKGDRYENGQGIISIVYSGLNPSLSTGPYDEDVGVLWNAYIQKENGEKVLMTEGFDAGRYFLIPEFSDPSNGVNYEIQVDGTYLLEITPYIVQRYDENGERILNFYVKDLPYPDGGSEELLNTIKNNVFINLSDQDIFITVDIVAYPEDYKTYAETAGKTSVNIDKVGTYYVKCISYNTNYVLSEDIELITVTVTKNETKAPGKLDVKYFITKDNVEIELLGSGGETLTVEDRVRLDFADDILNGLGRYDVAKEDYDIEFDENDGNWYLIPRVAGHFVKFNIDAEYDNYVDRSSNNYEFTVVKKDIYGILETDEFSYGDNILEQLKIKYYYKDGEMQVGTEVNRSIMIGLDDPDIIIYKGSGTNKTEVTGRVNFDVGEYTLEFKDGKSKGYNIDFYTSDKFGDTISVRKKEIYVIVAKAGSKVYGEGAESELYSTYISGDDTDSVGYILAYRDLMGDYQRLRYLPNGEEVVLSGTLSREPGEDVGEYDLMLGTLASSSNYSIKTEFQSKFAISRKIISIAVAQNQKKKYGESDPEFKLEPYLSEFAYGDDAGIFNGIIRVTREEGESVGIYHYTLEILDSVALSNLNYSVNFEYYSDNGFRIEKATPGIDFELTSLVYFGQNTDELTYVASAENATGRKVEGVFSVYVADNNAENGIRKEIVLTDKQITVVFIANDLNYSDVSITKNITVEKRPITISVYKANAAGDDSGTITFVYSAKDVNAKDFVCEVHNEVDGTPANIKLTLSGETKNVTKEGFTVKATLNDDNYELTGETEFKCSINKATVTVRVLDIEVEYGKEVEPIIKYEGFLGGDSTGNLKKSATVQKFSTEPGYHSLIPEGAEAQNYSFVYAMGVLTVNKVEAETEGVKITGNLSPTFEVTAEKLDSGSMAYTANANDIESGISKLPLVPTRVKMKEYTKVEIKNGNSGDMYQYTFAVSNLSPNDEYYVKLVNGEIKKVNVDIDEENSTVVFSSEQIIGFAVYEQKDIKEYILGFKTLMIVGGAILVVIIVLIIVGVSIRKKRKTTKTFAYRAKWYE